jgi:Holliday junction resolvase RusA-like endonuclease
MTVRCDNALSLADYRRAQGLGEVAPAPRATGCDRRVTRPEELREALVQSLEMERAKATPLYNGTDLRQPAWGSIRISIPGEPVAWARARSNGARRFTPAKQAAWMKHAQHYAVQQYGPLPPVTDALSLHVIATFAIPQSWTKSRKSAARGGTLRHTSKPDASNILKLVEDAMNGVVFVDDAQVTRALVEKRYGEPGVSVAVEVL